MLKSITCINIQAHKYSHLEFPKTGVVRIHGANSAGKTALFKPLFDILENNLSMPNERKSLINLDGVAGQYTITTWDGHEFTLNLHEEASLTRYSLVRPNGEKVERNLSDKVMSNLFASLGFHWDSKREVSLNVFHKDTQKLIVNTSPVFNGDLLRTAVSDVDAENAQVNLTELLKQIRQTREQVITEQSRLRAVLGSLEFGVDIESEEKRIKRLRSLKAALTLLNCEVTPVTLKAPEAVNKSLLYLPPVFTSVLTVPKRYNRTLVGLSSVDKIAFDYDTITKFEQASKAKMCPLCETPIENDKCGKLGEYLAAR